MHVPCAVLAEQRSTALYVTGLMLPPEEEPPPLELDEEDEEEDELEEEVEPPEDDEPELPVWHATVNNKMQRPRPPVTRTFIIVHPHGLK